MISSILILTTLLTTSFQTCSHDELNFRCVQYVDNYDGDTVTLDIPNVHPLIGSKIKIRIANIDTPEMTSKKACERLISGEAKLYVETLLKNASRIDLTNVERGSFFRIVANIIADGKSIGDLLIEKNMAVPYLERKNHKWCD